jgi:hypothetical protein
MGKPGLLIRQVITWGRVKPEYPSEATPGEVKHLSEDARRG